MLKRFLAKYFVKNVRAGFATNSSSSHSLVYYSDTKMKPKYDSHDSYEFGWGAFTLTSALEKITYGLISMGAHQTNYSSNDSYTEEEIRTRAQPYLNVLKRIFPTKHKEIEEHFVRVIVANDFAHVDHQSMLFIEPSDENKIEKRLRTLADPHVVIQGGNDNGGPGPDDFNDLPGVLYATHAESPTGKPQLYVYRPEGNQTKPWSEKVLEHYMKLWNANHPDEITLVRSAGWSTPNHEYAEWSQWPEGEDTVTEISEIYTY